MIVGRPGVVRDGYQALFGALSWARVLEPANDGPSALKRLPDEEPDIVILDAHTTDQATDILSAIRCAGLQSRCLVICPDVERAHVVIAAGADSAVVEGIPAMELAARARSLAVKEER